LVLEDLETEGLILKGETRSRRRRVYDAFLSGLRGCLEWVFQKQGKRVLAVPAYNTSRECFQCGGVNRDLTLKDRVFRSSVWFYSG
jgi:transposase